MDDRTIRIEDLATTKPGTFIETAVSFYKGEYRLRATPVSIDDPRFRSYNLLLGFSGNCFVLLTSKRFSRKVLEGLAASAKTHDAYPKVIEAAGKSVNIELAKTA